MFGSRFLHNINEGNEGNGAYISKIVGIVPKKNQMKFNVIGLPGLSWSGVMCYVLITLSFFLCAVQCS